MFTFLFNMFALCLIAYGLAVIIKDQKKRNH